ncbi:MAG: hypothetical protein ACRD3N_19380 [Terracidiphilus sp.]
MSSEFLEGSELSILPFSISVQRLVQRGATNRASYVAVADTNDELALELDSFSGIVDREGNCAIAFVWGLALEAIAALGLYGLWQVWHFLR